MDNPTPTQSLFLETMESLGKVDTSAYALPDDNRSIEARASAMVPPIASPSESFIGRTGQALGRGVSQMEDVAGGLAMMGGEAIGSEGLKKYGEGLTIGSERYQQANASPVGSFSDITGAGTAFEYITNTVAEMLPMNLVLLASGIGGAGIASNIAKAGIKGALTREAAAALTSEIIEKEGKDGALNMVRSFGAKDLADKAKALSLENAPKLTEKLTAARELGANVGVGAGSSAVETGSIASSINKETGSTGGIIPVVTGLAAGALDAKIGAMPHFVESFMGESARKEGQSWLGYASKEAAKAAGHEFAQESTQTAIETEGQQLANPSVNHFDAAFAKDWFESGLKGAIASGPMSFVSTIGHADPTKLKPATDPMVAEAQAEIKHAQEQKNYTPVEVTQADAEAAAGINKVEPAAPVVEQATEPAPPEPTHKELLIIANDKVKDVESKLKVLLADKTSDPSEVSTLQEEWKQAQTEKKALQAKIAGIDVEDMKPYEVGPVDPWSQVGEPAPNPEMAKDWLHQSFLPAIGDATTGIKVAIKGLMEPYSMLASALDAKMKFVTGAGETKVFWSDEKDADGRVTGATPTIQINTDHFLKLNPARAAQAMFHEVAHLAHFAADRTEWLNEGRQGSFNDYAQAKSSERAAKYRQFISEKDLANMSTTYTGGKDRTGAMFKPDSLDKKGNPLGKTADMNLDREVTRMIVEKIRNGKMDEELKILDAQAKNGNAKAKSALQACIEAIKGVRDAIVQFINPKTTPKIILETVKETNRILDKYADRTVKPEASPVVTSEAPSGVTTPPEAQKPVAGNVEQTNATPEASASLGSEIEDAFHEQLPSQGISDPELENKIIVDYKEKGSVALYKDGKVVAAIVPTNESERANGSPEHKLVYLDGEAVKGKDGEMHQPDVRLDKPEDLAHIAADKGLTNENTGPIERSSSSGTNAEESGQANPQGEGVVAGESSTPEAGTSESSQASASLGQEIPVHEREFTDVIVADTRGAANVAKATGRTDTQYAPRAARQGAAEAYVTKLNRPHWLSFEKVSEYLNKKGFAGAMRAAAAGTLGGMHPVDKLNLSGWLAHNALAYVEHIKYSADLSITQRAAEMREARDLYLRIAERMNKSQELAGQSVEFHKVLKQYFHDGQAAITQASDMMFTSAAKIEKAMGFGDISLICDAIKEALPESIDKIFTKGELTKHLAALVRVFTADPEKLYGNIKEAIKTRAAGIAAAYKAAANLGNEIMGKGSDSHMETLAKRIANKIEAHSIGTEREGSGQRTVDAALTKFAKDFFPKEEIPKPSEKNRNLKILSAIIANDKMKTEFLNALEGRLSENFKEGKKDPAFKNMYGQAFEEMRDAGWSEKMREDAISDITKNMKTSVAKILTSGNWKGGKEKILATLKSALGDMATSAQAEKLYSEVEASLDEQANDHIKNTFGFKKDENGKFVTTDAGNLKGGQGIRTSLKDMNVSLSDITKMSFDSREAEINKLANHYIDMMGLPEDMALQLQDVFAKELKGAVEFTQNKEIAKRIEDITSKLNNQKAKPETKSVIDKLVQLANQGHMDEKTIYEAIRQTYKNSNLPEFSPAVAEMIRKWGNEMDGLPEGVLKDDIRNKIANSMADMSGISWQDALKTYWYFSLLSGPSTFLVANPVGNAANLFFYASSMAINNPSAAMRIYGAVFKEILNKDSVSWAKFNHVMQTGIVPMEISAKYGTSLRRGSISESASMPVERITKEGADTWWKKGLYYLSRGLSLGKYEFSARSLSRFMAATDMLFRGAGTSAALEWQGVSITGNMIEKAMAQARTEVPAGSSDALIKIRADEIVKQDFAKDKSTQYALDRAEGIGLAAAYTQTPKGAVGSLAKFIGKLGEKYGPVKMLFPFTNIVANVWNESLDYTPIGTMRWGIAKWAEEKGQKSEWTILDKDGKDIADSLQLTKSMIGLGLTTMLGMMFMNSGPDRDLEIVGFGPKDKRERAMFFERGMRPYTIRFGKVVISYQAAGPISGMLGALGSWRDVLHENKHKKQSWLDNAHDLLWGAMASIATSQLSQSFVSSASNLAQSLYSTNPGSSLSKWAASQTSTIMPNFVRQFATDWINDDVYRSSSFAGQVMAGMAVTKMIGTQPVLNVYGTQVSQRRIPIVGRYVNFSGGDVLIADMLQAGMKVPMGSNTLNGAQMNDEQTYEFRKGVGPLIKQAQQSILPTIQRLSSAGDYQSAQDLLDNVTNKVVQGYKKVMIQKMRVGH